MKVMISKLEFKISGKTRSTLTKLFAGFQEIDKAGGIDFSKPVLLGYTGISNDLLLKYIDDSKYIRENSIEELRYTSIGSVIGTHAAPGAVAVAFFKN